MNTASRRTALILSIGLLMTIAGTLPLAQAAPAAGGQEGAAKSTEVVRPGKHRRHHARARTNRSAEKSADEKADKPGKEPASASAGDTLPASVANANAQYASAETQLAATATAMTAQANDNVQAAAADKSAGNRAPDQLSEADRALLPDQKTVVAAAEPPPRPAPVMASAPSDSSFWDQTSLIGKIFIAFGALLTLASAARMFMA